VNSAQISETELFGIGIEHSQNQTEMGVPPSYLASIHGVDVLGNPEMNSPSLNFNQHPSTDTSLVSSLVASIPIHLTHHTLNHARCDRSPIDLSRCYRQSGLDYIRGWTGKCVCHLYPLVGGTHPQFSTTLR